MRIHIIKSSGRKPRTGDRQVTKKHGLRIRIPIMYDGCYLVGSRGQQLYTWATPDELPERHHSWLSKEELDALNPRLH